MTKIEAKHFTRVVLIAILSALLFVGGCGNPGNTTPASPEASETQASPESAPKTAENAIAADEGDKKEKEHEADKADKGAEADKTDKAEKSDKSEEGDKSSEGDAAASLSNERIGFITQEYYGDNIVEIPYFEYEGEMNPEIESINRLLNQGLQLRYEDFSATKSEHEWIAIKSYPFTTDDYLQVVITKCVYPNYNTDGEIESINYDRNAKKRLTNEDALEMMGLSEEDLMFGVSENFDPEVMGGLIDSFDIGGFLIHGAPGDGQIEFLLNITVHDTEDGDDWQGFFSYLPDGNPNTDDLTRLDSYCLFDPYNMDEMEPPLWYQRNAQ